MSALIVVPTFMRDPQDLAVTLTMIESLYATTTSADLVIVDDGSPAQVLVDQLEAESQRRSFRLVRKDENEGFSKTVNHGLRLAHDEGKDAVLVNADIEFIDRRWLDCMEAQRTQDDSDLASVVGALLLYPNGLIQHAGIGFSFLSRGFLHRYQFAPADLPEAQNAYVCPVTGALQFIRHECLATIGFYDERFRMGFEDVDYCLRVFESGRECVYQPKVRAVHHESLFRGRADDKLANWQNQSIRRLMVKHRKTNLARWVGEIL